MRSEGYAVTADEVKLDQQDLARSNSLTDLAARIRIEHEATAAALQRRVMHAMAAGDLLIEAKAQLKHGQWLPWLAKHCVISERTAQLYVKLAKKRTTIEKEQIRNVADLTLNEERGLLDRTIIKIATEQSREVFQYTIGS
ncbi:MAG: DUF3102 domain-containing protein [Pseudolabrys sp.]